MPGRLGEALAFGLALAAGAAVPAWAGSAGRGSARPDGLAGGFGPSISADGRFVAFVSVAADLVPGDTNAVMDVFVRDRRAGTTERVSVGRAAPSSPPPATGRRSPPTGASSPSGPTPPT